MHEDHEPERTMILLMAALVLGGLIILPTFALATGAGWAGALWSFLALAWVPAAFFLWCWKEGI